MGEHTDYLTPDGLPWAYSATTLDALKTCPRYFYYTVIERLRPSGTNDDLTFGLIYQSALELYDREVAKGAAPADALDAALQLVLVQSWGWESHHTQKTRESLVRSVIWKLEEFVNDPLKTIILENGKPAVELSFRIELTEDIIIAGHLDRVVEYGGDKYVTDNKTTASSLSAFYFSRYEPDTQMSVYTLASQIAYKTPVKGVIVDACQVGVTFSRFARVFTHRSADQLEEFVQNTKWWIAQVPSYRAAGWPMNEAACGKYGGCDFRKICSLSPHVRNKFLAVDFERSTYSPLELRGE